MYGSNKGNELYPVRVQNVEKASIEEKLWIMFKLYDANGDELLQLRELEDAVRANMNQSKVRIKQQQFRIMTQLLFSAMQQAGAIDFDAFNKYLQGRPGLVQELSKSVNEMMTPRETSPSLWEKMKCPYTLSLGWLACNWIAVRFVVIFILINLVLIISRVYDYRHEHWFIIVAKATGQGLNFCSVLVLIFMLRRSLTWLRRKGLADYLPLDNAVQLHMMCGYIIVAYTVVHVMSHVANVAIVVIPSPDMNHGNWTLSEWLFTELPGRYGLLQGWANVTGVMLFIVLLIIVIGSFKCVRRSRYFEVFYFSHYFYVPFWMLLILHGPNFWKWFLVPLIIFLVEKSQRSKEIYTESDRVKIISGLVLPGKVVHLVIQRPSWFNFTAGDYVYIKVPNIARYQWHPFTISSAPERKDFLWLHIRDSGHWTRRLYSYFSAAKNRRSRHSVDYSVIDIEEKPDEVANRQRRRLSLSSNVTQDKILLPRKTSVPDPGSSFNGYNGGWTTDLNRTRKKTVTFPSYQNNRREKESGAQLLTKTFKNKKVLPVELQGDLSDFDDLDNEPPKEVKVKVFLDGPYGAPASHIFWTEHAVLIGAGIGVTPFAAILQSILYKYRQSTDCPTCAHHWQDKFFASIKNLKKIEFYWLNREQKSFSSFKDIIESMEKEMQHPQGRTFFKDFLTINLYLTSAHKVSSVDGLLLQLALDVMYEQYKEDLISGLQTRVKPGRPDWNEEFHKISKRRKGNVTVFFCGPNTMAEELCRESDDCGFTFRKENF